MGLPGLDVVLSLAASAVDILVDGASTEAVEAGDDEACVDALRPSLDAGDDALDAVPACGAIVEFLEPAQLLAASLGSALDRARLQRGDVLAQRGGRRDAEDVIEPLGPTEAQHLWRACVPAPRVQDLAAGFSERCDGGHVSGLLMRHGHRWPRWVPRTRPQQ